MEGELEEVGCEEKGQSDHRRGRGVIPPGGKKVGEVGEGTNPICSHQILRQSTWRNTLGE